MFFTGLIVFAVTTQVLPWYFGPVVACVLGMTLPGRVSEHASLAVSAGVAQAALAFWADGRLLGVVSRRLGGLLQLPSPMLMFAVMFGLGFISAFLWLRAGVWIRLMFQKGEAVVPSVPRY